MKEQQQQKIQNQTSNGMKYNGTQLQTKILISQRLSYKQLIGKQPQKPLTLPCPWKKQNKT